MPKFIIEREIPGAGALTPDQLAAVSQTSCGVLSSMGTKIQWIESFVTDDKIYCIYITPDEATVREHAMYESACCQVGRVFSFVFLLAASFRGRGGYGCLGDRVLALPFFSVLVFVRV